MCVYVRVCTSTARLTMLPSVVVIINCCYSVLSTGTIREV